MTKRSSPIASPPRIAWIDWWPFAEIPCERLALLRIGVGAYTLFYLATHAPMFVLVSHTHSQDFRPIGVLRWLDQPLDPSFAQDLYVVTLASTILFTLGWMHRPAALIHTALLWVVLTYRNSWSMIYHSQNLVVLHTLVLAIAPAARVWSIDAIETQRAGDTERTLFPRGRRKRGGVELDGNAWQAGWAIWLISATTVTTYWLAGIAKILGPLGWSWAWGTTMRDQIAVDAMRKEILSGSAPAAWTYALYPYVGLFTLLGITTLILEIGAPLVLLRKRWAQVWAVAVWLMHWGIYFLMGINFRYQLCGLVVASFFPLEQAIPRNILSRLASLGSRAARIPLGARVSLWISLVLLGAWLLGPRSPVPSREQTLSLHPSVQGERIAPGKSHPEQVALAIDRAVGYLQAHADRDGRWIYRTDAEGPREDRSTYNILRHAGTIYALSLAEQRRSVPANRAIIVAASTFLTQQIGSIPGSPPLLAVWSDVDYADKRHPRTAKLGGTGLALVALTTSEQTSRIGLDMQVARQLGEFLLTMQQPDGRMRSKWVEGANDGDTNWESLYYPGEAALGLVLLGERLRDDRYRLSAQRTLIYLARERAAQTQVPPDHWALLATRALLESRAIETQHEISAADRRMLLDHAAQICHSILEEQRRVTFPQVLDGCFTPDGRTTPTATRLEGLLAAHALFRQHAEVFPQTVELERAIRRGMAFILRAQIITGPRTGGFPRAIGRWDRFNDASPTGIDNWPSEVRIDYVQHALSALIAYEQSGLN